MSRSGFAVLVGLVFTAGFVGTALYQMPPGGRPVRSLLVPKVECDAAEDLCRKRLRAQAQLYFGADDPATAVKVLRPLALAGDAVAAFQLGWHHEEIYRAGVGRRLEAGSTLPEVSVHGPDGLPEGEAFVALIEARSAPADAKEALDAARALAFLWYAQAARKGFAPAANNLGSMYQFGLLGRRDEVAARRWYLVAYDAGSPVAAYNLERLRIMGYQDRAIECTERAGGGWLPLVRAPNRDDMFDDVLMHTRFRGRGVGRPMRDLLATQVSRFVSPQAWADEITAPPRTPGLWTGLVDEVKYGEPKWDFDDEEPAAGQKPLPTFEEARAASVARDLRTGDCSGARADPRSYRVQAMQAQMEEQLHEIAMKRSRQ